MSDSNSNRVAITGLGIFSPVGIGSDLFLESLLSCQSGIGRIERFSCDAAPGHVGAEVKEFDDKSAKKIHAKNLRKNIKLMCREIMLGVSSANQAVDHAGLRDLDFDRSRLGVDFGANLMLSPPSLLKDSCWKCTDEGLQFHHEIWGDVGLPHLVPNWLLQFLPNMPACHISIASDARGPSNSLTQGEASGNLTLWEASCIIQRGRADMMITGGTGSRIHEVKSIQAAIWNELAQQDSTSQAVCARPFDKHRTGQVLGEGACTLILEREDHAEKRGAKIYGHLLGCGSACGHPSRSSNGLRNAIANAISMALKKANVAPEEIGHIHAHGIGSQQEDIEEAAAIQQVFGDLASQIPVTALKSVIGNSGAGCGTLEIAASLLGLGKGVIPCTLNYTTPDEQCPLNVVSEQPLETDNKLFLNINFSNMGQASAVVVQSV